MEWIEAYLEDPIFQVAAISLEFSPSFHKPGGGSSLPGAALVHPRASHVHPGHPAPLHPHARHGDGEVHGAGGHLQPPVCRVQPGLDDPRTTPHPPTPPNTSTNVDPSKIFPE